MQEHRLGLSRMRKSPLAALGMGACDMTSDDGATVTLARGLEAGALALAVGGGVAAERLVTGAAADGRQVSWGFGAQ
jgi:hypothetical protein